MATDAKRKPNVCAKLIKAIGAVDRPGTVCTGGDRPLTMPGLQVDGLGPVRLPLGKTQARKLIKLCRQAPYGKGTETLVDKDVRRVWELDPDQFELTNPKWDELILGIVADVQQELGLADRKLTPHLYKLLVYEARSFFLPHRDGEKLDAMVATLVVALPSVHDGGELIISHEGKQHKLTMDGAATGHELSYAAFYADCKHEVQPVLSGYRLCLTYNVTLARSRGKKAILAPDHGTAVAEIAKQITDWSRAASSQSDGPPQKLAITLEHRYTQDGLVMDTLKGVDRARAEVLFDAAEQADCVTHLALVTHWENGSVEGGYDYSNGSSYRHGWDNDWDDDDEDEDASNHEMGEIFDESLSANHWSNREGKQILLGEISLEEDEIVSEEPLEAWETSREDFEGFTGNAGMTLERWYHRAAIVLWPREQHFSVLCDAGTDAAVGGLQPMVARLKRTAKARRETERQQCLSFAAAIIDSWQAGCVNMWDKPTGVDRSIFPSLLQELNDPALVHRFLQQVMVSDGEVQLDKSFVAFCKQHGWLSFETGLSAIVRATSATTIGRNAELLRLICLGRDKNADRIELCTRLAERFVDALKAFDDQPATRDWRVQPVDRSKLLDSLVRALLGVNADKPLSRLIDHALFHFDQYELTETHLAAIFALESRLSRLSEPNRTISHWLTACRTALETRTRKAPQKPVDYRRFHEVSCDCKLCCELSAFLADPDERQYRFALRKELRQHLHQIIDSNRCDLSHVTERKGRPYTLVCTKTTASYDAACQIHKRDLTNLARIVALRKKVGS